MKTTTERRPPPEEVLAFMLGSHEYGIDMQKVREIVGYSAFVEDAQGIDLDSGIARLPGTAMPVVDMRLRFSLGAPVYDESTSVIIVHVADQPVGMVVDGISDVHRIAAGQLSPAPRARGGLRRDHLIGLCTFGPHTVTLIAIDKLFSPDGDATLPAVAAPRTSNVPQQTDTPAC